MPWRKPILQAVCMTDTIAEQAPPPGLRRPRTAPPTRIDRTNGRSGGSKWRGRAERGCLATTLAFPRPVPVVLVREVTEAGRATPAAGHPWSRVLDVACGRGDWLRAYGQAGVPTLVGVDGAGHVTPRPRHRRAVHGCGPGGSYGTVERPGRGGVRLAISLEAGSTFPSGRR